jgi:hypothetical protein
VKWKAVTGTLLTVAGAITSVQLAGGFIGVVPVLLVVFGSTLIDDYLWKKEGENP